MTDRPTFSPRTRLAELVGVAVIVFVVVMGTAHVEPETAERVVDAIAYVCGVGAAVSLLLWRRAPLVMLGIVASAICVYLARSYPPGPALLPGPLSLVLLGMRVPRRTAWIGAFVVWAGVTLGLVIGDGRSDRLALAAVGWTLAAALAGQLIAARRDHIHGERERRRLADRQAVTDERLRIAQDLHDSVAHAMATINVQAGTAAHLLATRPEQVATGQVETALAAIKSASAEVLDELGAILGLLRRDTDGAVPTQPHVGLERLGELIERARVDGLAVTISSAPDLAGVSRPVSEAAYRVVQEALSNVRRHAPQATRVRVDVNTQHEGLVVEVVDDGAGATPTVSSEGFGLIGMRERVEASGGELTATPLREGGFRVLARWRRR